MQPELADKMPSREGAAFRRPSTLSERTSDTVQAVATAGLFDGDPHSLARTGFVVTQQPIEPFIRMTPQEYFVVGEFRNETTQDMTLYLEMTCEEVVLGPGHEVELLAKPDPDLLPLTTDYVEGGLQIHACRVADPDWHIRFKGRLIKPGYPTRLSEVQ